MSAKMAKSGGYDYQFVNEKKLPNKFVCPICRLVQREAHQVTCCGKVYCKSCLDELKSISVNFNCPNCRNSLEGEHKYFPDKNMISNIRHFAIYCDNKDKGCRWEGLLKDLEQGHLPKCPYHIISCSNNCGENLQRRKLDRHLIKCPRRQFTCPFCKTCGEHRQITGDHITTCPDYISECPNTGCDKRIKRRLMPHHHTECPKEIVPCHHSSIGCKTTIKREELLSHDQECMSSHLDLAVKEIHLEQEMIHKLRCYQERVFSHLEQKIHELRCCQERAFSPLQQEIHELKCDLEHAKQEIHELKCDKEHANQEIHELKCDKEHANQEICKLKAQTFQIPVIKMPNYSRNKEEWISPGFYVSTGSYKMALKVTTSKWFLIEYIYCYLALLPGEYDDTLEWPFQGEVTVELLNQKEDRGHKKKTIHFNKDTPEVCKKRVAGRQTVRWWGEQAVIDTNFLRPYLSDNDTLYFRISANKSWLL